MRTGRGAVGVVALGALLLLASERDTSAYVRYQTSTGMAFALMPPCLPLPIVVYPGTYSEMTVQEITGAVTAAAAAWSAGANSCTYLEFQITVMSGAAPRARNDGLKAIIFRDTSWCGLDATGICDVSRPYDPASLALTTVFARTSTGEIIDADIEIDAFHFSFADRGAHPELTDRYDLQNLLTHEFGHLVGLDSSCYPAGVTPRPTDNTGQPVADCDTASAVVQATTMFPSSSPDDVQKRTLEPDDRAGVCAIYPAAANPCPAGGASCACPPPGPDGGQDASVDADAGPNTNDDARPNTDGHPADAGRKSSGGGCSCEASGRPSERSWPVLVFLAAALVATRRSGPKPEARSPKP